MSWTAIDAPVRRVVGRAAGKVWAKTGTIDGVSTLAGYVCDAGKPRYAFAILMNKVGGRYAQARAAQDRICEALASPLMAPR